MSKTNKQLREQWAPLINKEGQAPIAEDRQTIVAKILENQEKDALENPEYRSEFVSTAFSRDLNEAEVGGDHGYDPTNIASGKTTGAITHVGAAVMGMVRRAIPNLIAFDIAGVQPLTQPTGQYFALRAVYGKNPLAPGAKEAFHPQYAPDASFSGIASAQVFDTLVAGVTIKLGTVVRYDFIETGTAYLQATTDVAVPAGDAEATDKAVTDFLATGALAELSEGMATSIAELQENYNGSSKNPWNEMGFRIDKQTVEAKSRQLKASYSVELAQDLRAVHNIDADAELSGILVTEIMLEINREILDWINYTAQVGKSGATLTPGSKAGVFDLHDPYDVRGARWQGEAFKAVLFQIDKEATEIARQTGRGAGNFIIASRNVVNLLASVDTNVSPAAAGLASGLNADTSKGLFSGILGNRYKVYIDQYARQDYFTVGYKGTSEMDAGIYYSPYVALTPHRATSPDNMQPVLGFKTRYAVGLNPFANSKSQAPVSAISNGMPTIESVGKNAYFRRVLVKGI